MKHYKYTVVFTDFNFQIVYAFCEKEARILAQAEQIKKGLSYNIDFVKMERE